MVGILVGNYTIPASSSPSSFSANSVHYANSITNGAYYGWCAATAGSCSSATTDGATAGSSICPKGWKLPTKVQYDTLLSSAGITNSSAGSIKIRGKPYNFPYAGRVFIGDSLQDIGSDGYYWSSTASGSNDAYYLDFNSSKVNIGTYARYGGISIRCIAP